MSQGAQVVALADLQMVWLGHTFASRNNSSKRLEIDRKFDGLTQTVYNCFCIASCLLSIPYLPLHEIYDSTIMDNLHIPSRLKTLRVSVICWMRGAAK